MLIAVNSAGGIVFKTERESWKVYQPGDRADWFNPQVALSSPTQPITVQPDPWYPQKELNAKYGNKALPLWSTPGNTFAYLYGVVGGERKPPDQATDAVPPVKTDSGQRPLPPEKSAATAETVIASDLNISVLRAAFSSRIVIAENSAALSSPPQMKAVLAGVIGEPLDIS